MTKIKPIDFSDRCYYIVFSNKCCYVQNYKEIFSLSDKKIILKIKNGYLSVIGDDLFIEELDEGYLLIFGNIIETNTSL